MQDTRCKKGLKLADCRLQIDFYEKEALKKGFKTIAGVDEAGRGPLAGPVVAAAVIFPFSLCNESEGIFNLGIRDSKKLTAVQRENISLKIFQNAVSIGLGIVWTDEIERINILNAAQKAMANAVDRLTSHPDFLIIDGPFKIPHAAEQLPIIKGDSLSVSIAAASIIAKVARDRIMDGYHHLFPEYKFKNHKGYGTSCHLESIKRHKPSPIHRKGFKGVKEHI